MVKTTGCKVRLEIVLGKLHAFVERRVDNLPDSGGGATGVIGETIENVSPVALFPYHGRWGPDWKLAFLRKAQNALKQRDVLEDMLIV